MFIIYFKLTLRYTNGCRGFQWGVSRRSHSTGKALGSSCVRKCRGWSAYSLTQGEEVGAGVRREGGGGGIMCSPVVQGREGQREIKEENLLGVRGGSA